MNPRARIAFAGLITCIALAATYWAARQPREAQSPRRQQATALQKATGSPQVRPAIGGIETGVIPVKTGINRDVSGVPLGRGIKGDVTPSVVNSGSTENSSLQESVRKAEYNITRQDTCVIDGMPGGLHAANRANNLRAYFRKDGVQLVERETSDPEWDLRIRLEAWGHDGAMQPAPEVQPAAAEHTNRVTYTRPGIEEWFENTESGLEHGFTITSAPPEQVPLGRGIKGDVSGVPLRRGIKGDVSGVPLGRGIKGDVSGVPLGRGIKGDVTDLILTMTLSGNTTARNTANPTAIEFTTPDGTIVAQLAQLDARDANGAAIPATISAKAGHTEIRLAVVDASYPITVKGLYVPPPIGDWQAYGEQEQAYFGSSVAGAGDVNGDGYADVIVGAYRYDNGQYGEGAAFVFLGSPSGIVGTDPATAAAMLESDQDFASMGVSVSGAGDVNGDGYADVIVGADRFDNGRADEGAAFVFLGSPSGIVGTNPATAAAMLESD